MRTNILMTKYYCILLGT